MSCEFAHFDGAYVLGALSAGERVEFERHLATCADCSRAVQALAGIPGLLSRVDAEVLQSPREEEPVPDTLLPSLVQQVRRTQRRRTWVTVGVAAAALLAVAAGSVAITNAIDSNSDQTAAPSAPTSSALPTGQPMQSVGGSDWMTADLAMTSVSWGTKLDLTCSYKEWPADWGTPSEPVYVMLVRTRDGHTEQVATWRGLPGMTMRLAAATATSRDDIASVEVRTADGTRVLKLTA